MPEPLLNIIQFTDLHIVPPEEQPIWPGVDTLRTCRETVDAATDAHPEADLFLLTGDLSHRPTPQAYHLIRDCMSDLPGPAHFIPGNHDDPELMNRHLGGGRLRAEKAVIAEHWQIILLDTTIPQETGGALASEELAYLDERLSRFPSHFALVCLHHQPLPVGSPWMDAIGLANPEALFEVTDRHAQVRGMLWGHIHQAFEASRRGILCMGTPSTCLQFTPHSDEVEADTPGPGYRSIRLLPAGTIESQVHYTRYE